MNHSAISLKIITNAVTTHFIQDNISPTIYDKFTTLSEIDRDSTQVLSIKTYRDLVPYLSSSGPVVIDQIVIDLTGFIDTFSRLLVYLGPLFCRWQGKELILILPETSRTNAILASFSDMLRSLELRAKGIRLISCPTCARCKTNFPEMVRSIENKLARVEKTLDVAVMGCEVNGPGEARAADIGIAFGDQKGMMFKRGEKIGVVSIAEAAEMLLKEIEKL